jgi:hypothetical protein
VEQSIKKPKEAKWKQSKTEQHCAAKNQENVNAEAHTSDVQQQEV